MTEFNDHQLRLWNSMLKLIEDYLKEKMTFPQLVESLEEILQAGEFKDEAMIKEWYNFWGPLEIYRAIKADRGEPVKREEIMKDIEAMKQFFKNKITHQSEFKDEVGDGFEKV